MLNGWPQDIGDVLLVEDNPGDVRLTKELFEEAGIDSTIHAVNDGSKALDFLKRRNGYEDAPRPDLVLVDWHLPKTTGGEILDKTREAADISNTPVVVLTGSGASAERLKEEVQAADEVPIKPIDLNEFPDTLGAV